MTPEEELEDFEPDHEWWDAYLKWAEACNEAAEEQYHNEVKDVNG
jgi:hypothetical protein